MFQQATDAERSDTGSVLDTLGTVASTAGGLLGDYAGLLENDQYAGVGDLVGGAGKLATFDGETGNWDPNWGGAGDIVNGVLSLSEHGDKALGGNGNGPIGAAVGGAAQALTNGFEAKQNYDLMAGESDPARRADHEHNMWGAAGDATLGALHAGLGSWNPAAEKAITWVEMACDSLGTLAGIAGGSDAAFGAGDAVGGMLDAVIPEEEDAWSTQLRNAIGTESLETSILGGLVGGAADTAMAPMRLLNAMSSASVNTIGNIYDDDRDTRDEYLDMNEVMSNAVVSTIDRATSWGSPFDGMF